jgi:hypothetical protein
MVAEVFNTSHLNFSWRKSLIGPKLVVCNDILPRLANIVLTHEQDELHRNLSPNCTIHYLSLIYSDVPALNKRIWSLNVHLKTKILLCCL